MKSEASSCCSAAEIRPPDDRVVTQNVVHGQVGLWKAAVEIDGRPVHRATLALRLDELSDYLDAADAADAAAAFEIPTQLAAN